MTLGQLGPEKKGEKGAKDDFQYYLWIVVPVTETVNLG